MRLIAVVVIFFVAAWLEVFGDLAINRGMQKDGTWRAIALGCAMLVIYGIAVNVYNVIVEPALSKGGRPLTFSALIGVYVMFFAIVGVFAERTWPGWPTIIGLAFIVVGSLIIQFGATQKGQSSQPDPQQVGSAAGRQRGAAGGGGASSSRAS